MRSKIQQTCYGILRRIRSFFSAKEREQDAFISKAVTDSTHHNHYSIAYKHSLYLLTSRNYKINIASINWSELSVFLDGIGRDQLIHSGPALLKILGEECRVFISLSYIGESLAGYQLVHENSNGLKVLKDFLGFLKKGSSLRFIYKSKNDEDFDRSDEIILIGQEATKLRIKLDSSGVIATCRLVFYFGDDIFELFYQDHALYLEPSLPIAASTLQVMRCGISILLGVQQTKIIRLLRPVFDAALRIIPHATESKQKEAS